MNKTEPVSPVVLEPSESINITDCSQNSPDRHSDSPITVNEVEKVERPQIEMALNASVAIDENATYLERAI